jgi:hypothetical protein
LRTLVRAFIQSECDEAAMRVALSDAVPLYRDAPEAKEARASGSRTVEIFMQEALPVASSDVRTKAGDLIARTLSSVGKHFSETPRTPVEIDAYADAMADMFCAYLRQSRAVRRGCEMAWHSRGLVRRFKRCRLRTVAGRAGDIRAQKSHPGAHVIG